MVHVQGEASPTSDGGSTCLVLLSPSTSPWGQWPWEDAPIWSISQLPVGSQAQTEDAAMTFLTDRTSGFLPSKANSFLGETQMTIKTNHFIVHFRSI